MKLKDYMVGDWILSEHQFPMKVVSVGTDYLYADFEGNEGDVFEFDGKCMPKPIPLTPQILEKNGWKKHATYGLMKDDVKEDIYMLYEHEFEIVFINQEPVSIRRCIQSDDDGYDKLLINYQDTGMYVHVLQHAFRLFDLDNLADNFKVE